MKTKHISKILFAVTLGSSAVASANGFNVNEHDARVTGRGGATAASNDTPSSIVFNPGGIPIAEGTNFSVGLTSYIASGSYTPEGGGAKTTTDSQPAFAPSLYVTSRVHDKVAVGIGLHFPFGLAVSWPTGHMQSDTIQDQSLRTYFITPAFGLNLNKEIPGLTIGGGVDIVPATVQLERTITFGDAQGTAVLGGDALGIGGRFGVMYAPPKAKQIKLGAMWRSDVNLDFSGNGDFDIDPQYRGQLPPDGKIATTIHLPQSIAGGIAFDPNPELEIEMNAVWINWEKFNELRITLPDGSETNTVENYHNTVTFRIGADYKLAKQNAAIRAGFIYDPTPIPDTTLSAQLPDVNRKNITIGGSKYFGAYAAHAAFEWVTPGERKTSSTMYTPEFKGTYGVQAFVFSLNIAGHFGGGASQPAPAAVAE
ncbi:MAG TPA: outer membrane protein transport protein [Kofleriaceae bacterium]|nr:outer membrane protein transport protein [Kofleriaceae bacterium]